MVLAAIQINAQKERLDYHAKEILTLMQKVRAIEQGEK